MSTNQINKIAFFLEGVSDKNISPNFIKYVKFKWNVFT